MKKLTPEEEAILLIMLMFLGGVTLVLSVIGIAILVLLRLAGRI